MSEVMLDVFVMFIQERCLRLGLQVIGICSYASKPRDVKTTICAVHRAS